MKGKVGKKGAKWQPPALSMERKKIKGRIYTIRGTQVMLDKDLAELYEVQAIRLREQVKRNKKRFPQDFHMFQLTDLEADTMVSQNAIPSKEKKHLRRLSPLCVY